MNAKKCKAIRQFLRNKGDDVREARYEVHPTQRGVRSHTKLGPNGKPQTIIDAVTQTMILVRNPPCGRALYKDMKKTAKLYGVVRNPQCVRALYKVMKNTAKLYGVTV